MQSIIVNSISEYYNILYIFVFKSFLFLCKLRIKTSYIKLLHKHNDNIVLKVIIINNILRIENHIIISKCICESQLGRRSHTFICQYIFIIHAQSVIRFINQLFLIKIYLLFDLVIFLNFFIV